MIVGYVSKQALALLFLFFGLTIAVIIKQLQKSLTFIPYTPTLFMVSVVLGYFEGSLGVIGESISTISDMDPRGILLIFLPPLIFEGAFNSDWYIFRKQSTQIFILAFPSVLVSALFIMFSLKVIINYSDEFYDWPEAFMFGSVLSCTDTVAVLALLKEAGAPKKFNSLIQGESLFNDGTCMVLLTISLEMVKGGSMHVLSIVQLFFELTLGAIVLGVLAGIFSTFLIRLINRDSILTINITIAMCYILYFIAEYVDLGIRISGIMALVSMGLYMAAFGKTKFTPEAREKTHEFWKVFVFVAETIIFILGGVMVGTKALGNDSLIKLIGADEIQKLLLLYLCMMLARFISIAVFMPKLQVQGYGLKWNEVCALTYGGLRGAVGIAFTLILASNQAVPFKTRIISLFNMAGCSFLTLLINAPTCAFVIKKIGVCVKSEIKIKLFKKFIRECTSDLEHKVEELQQNKHLAKSNWQQVKILSGIQELKKYSSQNASRASIEMIAMIKKNSMQAGLLDDHIADNVDPLLMKQIRNRFGVALKGIFWDKFEKNQCSGESIRNLIQCVDLDMDSIDQPLVSWEYLIGHLHNPIFFPVCFWLRKFPIIKHLAFSLIYDRVMVIYDIVSTYLEGLLECEKTCLMFPFEREALNVVINESKQNRMLAQSFLDKEIKVAYPQIMKRIQTAKASHSLLTYQKELLNQNYRHGQIDCNFYKQMAQEIQKITDMIQNDSGVKQELSEQQILLMNEFFNSMDKAVLKELLKGKVEEVFQKDEPIIKAYQKQKYIYLITRGEISEQWKENGESVYKKTTKLYQIAGISPLWNTNKEVQYSCTADSIICLYCFPLTTIKEIIMKDNKLQSLLFKEMLPLLLKLHSDLKTQLTTERWADLKPFVIFRKLLKDECIELHGQYIILLEGTMSTDKDSYGRGYYNMTSQLIKVTGPAKVFYSNSPFETQEAQRKTIGDIMMKSENIIPSRSTQRRSTILGEAGGAINRTLFTKDDQ